MSRTIAIALVGAVLAVSAAPTIASAQSQVRGAYFDPARQAPPLVIRKRPFTDSGTAAPVGYDQANVSNQTVLNQPVYSSFRPDAFGQDVLPHRFDGLGLN